MKNKTLGIITGAVAVVGGIISAVLITRPESIEMVTDEVVESGGYDPQAEPVNIDLEEQAN